MIEKLVTELGVDNEKLTTALEKSNFLLIPKETREKERKEDYEKAFGTSAKVAYKEIAKKIGLNYDEKELSNKNFESFIEEIPNFFNSKVELIVKEKAKQIESDLKTKLPDEIKQGFVKDLSEKEKNIEKLQSEILNRDTIISDLKNSFAKEKINSIVKDEFVKINIEIPAEIKRLENSAIEKYIENERFKMKAVFDSLYEVQPDEKGYKIIEKSTNTELKDSILNPIPLPKILEMLNSNYNFNVTKNDQKQQKPDLKSTDNIDIDLKKIKNTEQFYEYAKKQGWGENSNELAVAWSKFRKMQKTN